MSSLLAREERVCTLPTPLENASGVEIRGIADPVERGGNALFGANYPVDEAMIRLTPVRIIGWGLDPEAGWLHARQVERT